MNPLKIRKRNQTVEVVAKITDSIVQEYGCRVKYNKVDGRLDLEGDGDCREIVSEVLREMMGDSP